MAKTRDPHEACVQTPYLEKISKSTDSNASLINETRVQNGARRTRVQIAYARVALTKAKKRQDHLMRILLINARTAFTNQMRACEIRVDF